MSDKYFIDVPDDTESYIQETGHGGRDDKSLLVLVLVMNQSCDKNIKNAKKMHKPLCRRDVLLEDRQYKHLDLGHCAHVISVLVIALCRSCESNRMSLNFLKFCSFYLK